MSLYIDSDVWNDFDITIKHIFNVYIENIWHHFCFQLSILPGVCIPRWFSVLSFWTQIRILSELFRREPLSSVSPEHSLQIHRNNHNNQSKNRTSLWVIIRGVKSSQWKICLSLKLCWCKLQNFAPVRSG